MPCHAQRHASIHLSAEKGNNCKTSSKPQGGGKATAADASKDGGELRDADVAKALDASVATVERTRRRLASFLAFSMSAPARIRTENQGIMSPLL